MKGQPLTYNRDNQEDKEPLFDTIDTALSSLEILTEMVPEIVFHRDTMRAAASEGYTTATDLADYLVCKGIAFRDAHAAVGQAIAAAEANGIDLADLPLPMLQEFCQSIDEDVFQFLTLDGSVQSRDHTGGTAPVQVRLQIENTRKRLDRR
jgi:argininosuccinate lyase